MKKTKNYAMPYPEQDDYFNVEDFQDMMVSVDDLMKKLSDSGAQISSDAEHLYNQTKAQMDNIQKRMNAFTALRDGSTTGDAELKDIRVAYDGKEYGNAGEAVREQASDIHKALFGAGASIWSKAKSESTKYVAETKGICILNECFTAAGVVTKISRGTFAENESTLNLDRECSAYIVEFEKNPGTVYMPSAETIKIVSTTKIIFEANGNARCWIPVKKGQYLAVDSTATAYTSESNHVPYMLYDQANKTLECRGFGSTGSIEPVDPYSLALEYKLEYDMDDTGLVKQIDANREASASLKTSLSDWSRLEGYELANLMPKLKLVKENKYASLDEIGKPPYYGAYDGCNVYSLDIESDVYTFTEARMILPIDEKGNVLAERINYATSFDNTKLSASKIYLSITDAKESIKSFSISKGTQLRKFDKFPEHTGIPKLENDVKKLENDVITENMPLNMHSVKKIGKFEKNGDSILLSDARTNLRKGIRLIFEANIVNGADFEIGFSISESSADTLPHNRFVVNSTTIEYYESIGQTECSNSFTHKLSISKNVQVIFEYLANGTVDICLLSNGEVFKKNIIFTMNSVAVPYVKSNGLVAKDCKFTFICTDIRKKIWCFGDSYFAYSTARWTYYLREHGYDNNVLLDGFPGMGSTNARSSFSKLLKLGKPKIAVWFEGMNDGADTTDSEPNDDWKSNKDIFIALCEENSVEPVFATIPNVPNINHKGKNKWVKESGYRYIDMCHAVGADVDVNWYGNMLSNDKIHPSENGARALFVQVLLDLPEVMIDNL